MILQPPEMLPPESPGAGNRCVAVFEGKGKMYSRDLGVRLRVLRLGENCCARTVADR